MPYVTPRILALISVSFTKPNYLFQSSIRSSQLSRNDSNASPCTVHLVEQKLFIIFESFLDEFLPNVSHRNTFKEIPNWKFQYTPVAIRVQ